MADNTITPEDGETLITYLQTLKNGYYNFNLLPNSTLLKFSIFALKKNNTQTEEARNYLNTIETLARIISKNK